MSIILLFNYMVVDMLESELREGNFIFYAEEVIRLNDKNIDLIYLRTENSMEGIEMNVNWLENFGFFYLKSCESHSTFFYNGVKVELGEEYSKVYMHNIEVKKIRYVHELQNIFFALTGEELVHRDFSLT